MKKSHLPFIIALIIIINSCTANRYIYAPSAPMIPYFNEKHDSKASAFYSGSGDGNITNKSEGLDLQGAYAIGNNWALTGAYFYRNELSIERLKSVFDSSNVHYNRNISEFGGGYFLPLNPQKTITVNVYAAFGGGKFNSNETGTKGGSPYSRYYNVNITKWYVQPSIHFMPGKYFRFAFFFKPTFVHYGRFTTDYLQDEIEYFSLDKLYRSTIPFMEIGYNLQLGIPQVPWLFIEHSVSGVSRHIVENTHLLSRGGNVSIGLSVNFNKISRKKKMEASLD